MTLCENFLKFRDKTISYLDLLANQTSLAKYISDITNNDNHKNLGNHYAMILNEFANQNQQTILEYFDKKIPLVDYSKKLASFIASHEKKLTADHVYSYCERYNKVTDSAIKKALAHLKPAEEFNLLSFGLGEGQDEIELAKYLKETGMAKTVNLFGFDPFVTKMRQEIQYLSPDHLISKNRPKFNLVLAKWSLHHVRPSLRWRNYVSCLNNLKQDGLSIMLEDCLLENSFKQEDELFVKLLTATYDVANNMYIRPKWFMSTAPNIGENFFIRYLKLDDIETIKENTKIPLKTIALEELGTNFPCQTI